MHFTKPEVFVIGETRINAYELEKYLHHIGAGDWYSDANSDIEEIVEVAGRGCYKSFGTDLNENITRVRETNKEYLEHIINVRHGSVLEHAFINFMFCDVSRVFTHELVRHRPGVAISQESLRFVRVNNLGCYLPDCFNDTFSSEKFDDAFSSCERVYQLLLASAGLKEHNYNTDSITLFYNSQLFNEGIKLFNDLPFEKKKEYTSAARRVLPIGMATNICWSCNIRSLRHILEMRTHPGSEEEIRYVFAQVGDIALNRWEWLFSDYEKEIVDNIPWFKTSKSKV